MEGDVDPSINIGMNTDESINSSIIRFTSISGARQEMAPNCYLLEIDQCKILLDCGCLYDFDMSHMESLRKIAKDINIIAISHANIRHLGALPYLFDNLGCSCPILVTVPIHHFGMFVLKDAVESYKNTFGKSLGQEYNFSNIEKLFDQMIMLRYSQPFLVQSGPAKGMSLSAFPAGHSVGGSIWKIKKNNEDIVYAMNFNHRREAHLDGASFEMLSQATVLIGDSKSSLNVPILRKNRDQSLIDDIISTLKQGGSALIPIDAVCRALEVIQILNQKWMELKLSFPIVFLSYSSRRIIEIARGLIEWTGSAMMKNFEQFKENPFECKYIKSCHSISDLEDISDPKVILATTESLDCGLSRAILVKIASSSKNIIIHPGFDTSPTSLIRRILTANKQEKIKMEIKEQVPLEGDELKAHNKKIQEEREAAAAESAYALHKKRMDEEAMEEFEELEDENLKLKTDLMEIDSANKLREIYWSDYKQDCLVNHAKFLFPSHEHLSSFDDQLFFPLSIDNPTDPKPCSYQMFPYKERRLRKDAYGAYFDHSLLEKQQSLSLASSLSLSSSLPQSSELFSNETQMPSSSSATATAMTNSINIDTRKEINNDVVVSLPTKWVSTIKEFTVKCSKKSIDFCGLIDGRSLKTIYQEISPRHLILVGGNEDATEFLANHFRFLATQQEANKIFLDVYAPKLEQSIVISSSINVLSVILSEQLLNTISYSNYLDYEITRLRGIKDKNDQGNLLIDNEGETEMERKSKQRQRPILLGNPKLKDLRKVLNTSDISAEFLSGDLICSNGNIRLKKLPDTNTIMMEGVLSPDYYKVRQNLYSNLGII